jgi:hypothetical protein
MTRAPICQLMVATGFRDPQGENYLPVVEKSDTLSRANLYRRVTETRLATVASTGSTVGIDARRLKMALLPLTSTAQMAVLWCGVNSTVFRNHQLDQHP